MCRVVFGAEPKDCEIYVYILNNYNKLSFSSSVNFKMKVLTHNPKRKQREAKKQIQNIGISTKSQQALKLQQEQMKKEHKQLSRKEREAEKQRKFELRQQKRKEKHNGR